MSELSEISSGRPPANRARIQQSMLEDQMDLWWFEDPKRSILCYSVAVVLILGSGVGGIVLLSTATSKSSEWRIGVGTILCLLALLILLKQLLSSAIQDMNCMRNRAQIDILRSGGLIDHLVCLVAGSIIITCGCILAILAKSDAYLADIPWNDMFVAGVTLAVAGSMILLSLLLYLLIIKFCPRVGSRPPSRRIPNVYLISGAISERRPGETSSSQANLV